MCLTNTHIIAHQHLLNASGVRWLGCLHFVSTIDACSVPHVICRILYCTEKTKRLLYLKLLPCLNFSPNSPNLNKCYIRHRLTLTYLLTPPEWQSGSLSWSCFRLHREPTDGYPFKALPKRGSTPADLSSSVAWEHFHSLLNIIVACLSSAINHMLSAMISSLTVEWFRDSPESL